MALTLSNGHQKDVWASALKANGHTADSAIDELTDKTVTVRYSRFNPTNANAVSLVLNGEALVSFATSNQN